MSARLRADGHCMQPQPPHSQTLISRLPQQQSQHAQPPMFGWYFVLQPLLMLVVEMRDFLVSPYGTWLPQRPWVRMLLLAKLSQSHMSMLYEGTWR